MLSPRFMKYQSLFWVFFVFGLSLAMFIPGINLFAWIYILLLPLPIMMITIVDKWSLLLTTVFGLFIFWFQFVNLLPFITWFILLGILMGKVYSSNKYQGFDAIFLILLLSGIFSIVWWLFFSYVSFFEETLQLPLENMWLKIKKDILSYNVEVWNEEYLEKVKDFWLSIIPVIWLVITSSAIFLNYHLATFFLKRFNLRINPIPPFYLWRFNKNLVYGFILAFLLSVFISIINESAIYNLNILLIFHILMVIQGLSFFVFLIYKRKLRKRWFWFFNFLVFLYSPLSVVLFIAGILDIFWPLRDRISSK